LAVVMSSTIYYNPITTSNIYIYINTLSIRSIIPYTQFVHLIHESNKFIMSTSQNIAVLDTSIADRLPASSKTLFEAKAQKSLTFETIAQALGRSEVAVAALFYGQARASPEDVKKLAQILEVPEEHLASQLLGFPDRGHSGPMPPVEPLIYRLFEIIQNYGYAYKAVLNEKFGDGIMSAISFSTKVEKETDEQGNNWAVITLRGKWLPFSRF